MVNEHSTIVVLDPTPRTPAARIRSEQGRKLREMRKLHKLSQAALAESVGVTKASVSDWERGISSPRDAHQAAIARVLNCSWSALFQPPAEAA